MWNWKQTVHNQRTKHTIEITTAEKKKKQKLARMEWNGANTKKKYEKLLTKISR